MKYRYQAKRFNRDSLEVIHWANSIITEYAEAGYRLTLRQLYYQFVSRDLLPNTQQSYKRLGGIISDGRLAGLIDWEAIEDRTRNLSTNSHWEDPSSIVSACAEQFQLNKWEGQPNRVEVWVEKEALAGVLSVACSELDVPFFACKGYTSQSEMYRAGRRLAGYRASGAKPVVIHLGDHDPSGIDMTRDVRERLELLSEGPVKVVRIALNLDQVQQYNPPPNPAKLTDTRAGDYVAKFGRQSWELDALPPRVLVELVSSTVLNYRREDLWLYHVQQENEHRRQLQAVSDNWDKVSRLVDELG